MGWDSRTLEWTARRAPRRFCELTLAALIRPAFELAFWGVNRNGTDGKYRHPKYRDALPRNGTDNFVRIAGTWYHRQDYY